MSACVFSAKGRVYLLQTVFVVCMSLVLVACGMDPGNVDVKLKKTAPHQKITTYTQALSKLGLMTEIYDTGVLKIQCSPIGDNTGTSQSTGGEIPRDITEIMKSALNTIGGNVVYIPYDPAFIQNQMVTGYSNFDTKLIPDVVITGGITEFDRGLETRGEGTDVGAEAEFTGMPKWLPSQRVSVDYSSSSKTGLARITLDFNLLNFKTMSGIARMNTVNSMEVTKAMGNKELGITIFGPTFGRKGSIKKVQGRHAAIRLLVELSVIQMIGKDLILPYWRLLGEDNEPDPVVIEALQKRYYRLSEYERNIMAQEWLFLHGYHVELNGTIDDLTMAALHKFNPELDNARTISVETFIDLYTTIPIDQKTLGLRHQLNQMMLPAETATQPAIPNPRAAAQRATQRAAAARQTAQRQQSVSRPAPAPSQRQVAAAPQTASSAPAPAQQQQAARQIPSEAQQQKAAPVKRHRGIGRLLDDDEW